MPNRETFISTLRGETLGFVNANSSSAEVFQNQTLRPILKLQNELFLQLFSHYFAQHKGVFYTLSPENKQNYVNDIFQNDKKFTTLLKGIVIGLFSIAEYKEYIALESELNKRMMNMLLERINSQIAFFSQENSQNL